MERESGDARARALYGHRSWCHARRRRCAFGAWRHCARSKVWAWHCASSRQFQPDVVLLTGGFVGVPVSVAAWLCNVPSVVYLPDIEPGLALKVMARFATKVATTTEASAPFIGQNKDKMVVTGYPVREAFANVDRDQSARAVRHSKRCACLAGVRWQQGRAKHQSRSCVGCSCFVGCGLGHSCDRVQMIGTR